MPQSRGETEKRRALATYDDVTDILGILDDDKASAIMALRPTVADIEWASIWLSGDTDIFGAGQPLKELPGQIVAILTADEEENASRGR